MKRTRYVRKLWGVGADGVVGVLSPLLVVALFVLLVACGTRDNGPWLDEPATDEAGAVVEVALPSVHASVPDVVSIPEVASIQVVVSTSVLDICRGKENCCRHRWDCPGGYICARSYEEMPPGYPPWPYQDERACLMPGSCFAIDQIVPDDSGFVDAMVCGCNGVLYPDYRGAIESGMMAFYAHERCREMQEDMVACSSSSDCDDDEWCERRWCQPRPETCPDDLWPVCAREGSTRNTYDNPCKAALAEAHVVYRGECR